MVAIQNVSFQFKHNKILENANYSFEKGKVYFLIARNGAGKSTIFKLINGDMKVLEGEVFLQGSISFHKQNPIYFEDMKVKENLETFMECFNSNKNYKEIIGLYNLESIEKKVVRKLSGGEKQKLYLAITGLVDDDILLFDEADSALDPIYREFYYTNILKREAEKGKIVIAISHHLNEVVNYADEICFLKNYKLYKIKPNQLADNFRDLNEDKMLKNLEEICDHEKISY
ncbi:ATP-binding cassette domain-containing protein [Lysinibacillus xylanilyticus]|uniref:ATP-binding cassette domain-containing protein n=1 Tax=Lysinibacillus xylanilyticus TaxID=582475 RepID=UPI00380B7FFD